MASKIESHRRLHIPTGVFGDYDTYPHPPEYSKTGRRWVKTVGGIDLSVPFIAYMGNFNFENNPCDVIIAILMTS